MRAPGRDTLIGRFLFRPFFLVHSLRPASGTAAGASSLAETSSHWRPQIINACIEHFGMVAAVDLPGAHDPAGAWSPHAWPIHGRAVPPLLRLVCSLLVVLVPQQLVSSYYYPYGPADRALPSVSSWRAVLGTDPSPPPALPWETTRCCERVLGVDNVHG